MFIPRNNEFYSGFEYERKLVETAYEILEPGALFIGKNESISNGNAKIELDFVFEPRDFEPVLYIFEFKYSHSYTLSDAVVNTQLAYFSELQRVNPQATLKFLLITNARKLSNFINAPENLRVITEVMDEASFREILLEWISVELPGYI